VPFNFAESNVSLCVHWTWKSFYLLEHYCPSRKEFHFGVFLFCFAFLQGQICFWVTYKLVEGIKLLMLIHCTILWTDLIYYAATQSYNKQYHTLSWKSFCQILKLLKMPTYVQSLQTQSYFSVGCPTNQRHKYFNLHLLSQGLELVRSCNKHLVGNLWGWKIIPHIQR
jgi:hypothetical protein